MAKKRVYEVVNNNPHKNSLKIGDETLKFNQDNFMYVHEEDKGKEIQRLYDGTDAIVNETEIYVGAEPGHHYTFGPMTSRAAEEFWDRYEKKKAAKKISKKRRRRRKSAEVKHGL